MSESEHNNAASAEWKAPKTAETTSPLDGFSFEEREQIVDQALSEIDIDLQQREKKASQMVKAQQSESQRFEKKYYGYGDLSREDFEKKIRQELIDDEAAGKIEPITDPDLRRKIIDQRIEAAITEKAGQVKMIRNEDLRKQLVDTRILELAAERSKEKMGGHIELPSDDDFDKAFEDGLTALSEIKTV